MPIWWDYDHRERDPRIESDPAFAVEILRRLGPNWSGWNPGTLARLCSHAAKSVGDHGDSP